MDFVRIKELRALGFQQMIDAKFNECGSDKSETDSPSCDKQQPKKTALRDLQNDNRTMVPKSPGNHPYIKDRVPFMDGVTVSGIKRPATESAQSSIFNQPPISSGANGHLVYARRKSEQEVLPKSNYCEKDKNTDCAQQDQHELETPQRQSQSDSTKKSSFSAFSPASLTSAVTTSRGPSPFLAKLPNELASGESSHGTHPSGVPNPGNSHELETLQRQAQSESTKKSSFSAFTPVSVTSPMMTSGGPSPFLAKPPNELASGESSHGTHYSGVPNPSNSQGMNDQHWKDRFLRLQSHLRNCDHSSHQEYIKMLQSLSPVGRSKHAVELEKRAIQLLLEEGHELMRMKHLNVLGKAVPVNSVSPLTQQIQTEK